jgi:TolB-like protein
MVEDLITDLSKQDDIAVMARQVSEGDQSLPERLHHMRRALKVHYVLAGSIRQVGNRVRITAQLVDTATGHYLWANRYDRDLHDVFAMQDEIAQKIVAALVLTLSRPKQARFQQAHMIRIPADRGRP